MEENTEKTTIFVKTPDGEQMPAEVLTTFNIEGIEKEYIMYTFNNRDDSENVEVFVSILKEDGEDIELEAIEDEEEWQIVKEAMAELIK